MILLKEAWLSGMGVATSGLFSSVLEGCARDFAIVEVFLRGSGDLVVFVAFASDEHEVPGACAQDRREDSGFAVELQEVPTRTGFNARRGYLRKSKLRKRRKNWHRDLHWIFRARIVARDDRDICTFPGRNAHRTALLRVSVAAAPKDAERSTSAIEAYRRQDPRERVRCVCVVYENNDVVIGRVAALKATGYAGCGGNA